jgi:hypothetical protein
VGYPTGGGAMSRIVERYIHLEHTIFASGLDVWINRYYRGENGFLLGKSKTHTYSPGYESQNRLAAVVKELDWRADIIGGEFKLWGSVYKVEEKQ